MSRWLGSAWTERTELWTTAVVLGFVLECRTLAFIVEVVHFIVKTTARHVATFTRVNILMRWC